MDKIIDVKKRKRGGNDERTSWKNYRFCKRKQNSARVYHLEANLSREWHRDINFLPGESILTPIQRSVGVSAIKDSIYKEIGFRKETIMNEVIKAGEVFKLAELLPYQEGKIVNMDLAHNDKMKFVVMSFDAGTGLSEHAAPGEALVMALDGEAVIGYEGQEQVIHAGETFKFDKFGKHSVSATKQFKMALLLVLE